MDGLRREFPIFRSSLSLSIAAHLLFLLICAVLISERAAQTPWRKTTYIELERISPNAKTQPNQRIVQTQQVEKSDKAAPNAFLGAQNQIVDRQTVSKDKTIQMGESKTTTARHDDHEKATKQKDVAVKSPVAMPLQNLGVAMLPTPKELDEIAKKRAEGEDRSERFSTGEQAPKDYIKGMKEGEATALNTREYMFYGYYQRIRERLDRAWVPLLRANVNALYKRGRTLASEMEYSTRVLVVMNGGGEIVKVEVQTESGTRDLDSAAVEAFNKAGPFPNPPKGMTDPNGEIKIPWEFILRT